METKKLKGKLHENETQDSAANLTDLPLKKGKTKKNLMQMEKKKKALKAEPKNFKSKGKKACVDSSKKSKRIAYKRTRPADVYDDTEDRFNVMERAAKVLECLENGLPHFLKCMLPSNVSHGFWLHLPAKFCNLHLPDHDVPIFLVDEWGDEYKTSYLVERHGLSAGWRGFSVKHSLRKGDILIFHLTEPCKLKVHIVRVNGPGAVDAALWLVNLRASNVTEKGKRRNTEPVEPFLPDLNIEVTDEPNSIDETGASQSAIKSDGFSAEGLVVGSENAGSSQPSDRICYSGVSFLHDRPRELLSCT